MSQLLEADDVERLLAELHGWARSGDSITRTVKAPDFLTGIQIVTLVARVAEDMDHHPDIDIRWRTVVFVLSTHSAGGITQLDIDLAGRINEIVSEAKAT